MNTQPRIERAGSDHEDLKRDQVLITSLAPGAESSAERVGLETGGDADTAVLGAKHQRLVLGSVIECDVLSPSALKTARWAGGDSRSRSTSRHQYCKGTRSDERGSHQGFSPIDLTLCEIHGFPPVRS